VLEVPIGTGEVAGAPRALALAAALGTSAPGERSTVRRRRSRNRDALTTRLFVDGTLDTERAVVDETGVPAPGAGERSAAAGARAALRTCRNL
jgi:hypothetical protein